MFLKSIDITAQTPVSEIVANDYRTAEVFQKHGIAFCCAGRWPLEMACVAKGLEPTLLMEELHAASRSIQLPGTFPFDKWSIDFLIDYIINVHHYYLEKTLPGLEPILDDFIVEHNKKYPYLEELLTTFKRLQKEMIPHLREEEEVIFPYIRQVARAWKNKDSYAGLLVRTLRKPVGAMWDKEHDLVSRNLLKWREITNNYVPPAQACVNHQVILARLKELDNNIVQHVYLENEILYPKTTQIEQEILQLPT